MNIYNFLLEKVVLPFGDRITKNSVCQQLKYWRQISHYSETEINNLSNTNLSTILNFAIEEIPYYRNLKIEKREDPQEWLKQFPVLTKDIIKTNMSDLIYGNIHDLIKSCSSGSSGVQGITYQNKKELSATRALNLFMWESAGYRIGDRILQTGITPNRGFLKTLKDLLFRTEYVSAYDLDDKKILSILKKYKNKKNIFFCGYASSLGVFAESALKNSLNDISFKRSMSWGDKLFDQYKNSVNEAFGCEVNDTYGCSEGIIIGMKVDLDYFYIFSPHVVIEIVDKNGNEVKDGEMGYVLLTRLDGFSMPLIRYYIGDLAIKLPKEKYPQMKKFNFPLLERVIGRDTDVIINKNGKKLIVHFFTGIFEHYDQIKQFRVIQTSVDFITIEYIQSDVFSIDILDTIAKEITTKLNDEINIIWKCVEVIPNTPSGKPQIIKSEIGKII